MDKALKKKDIPAFLTSYKEAKELADILLKGDDDPYKNSLNKHAGRILLDNLSSGDYGSVYRKVLQYGKDTYWEKGCSTLANSSLLIDDLIRFGRIRYAAKKGEVPKLWDLDVIFDDKLLTQERQEGLDTVGSTKKETGNNLPDGRYTSFGYNNSAQLFMFDMIDITTPEVLGRNTTWLCSVVDLGADGIDKCDAKLNGVTDIEAANRKYSDCMLRTREKLVSRYSEAAFNK